MKQSDFSFLILFTWLAGLALSLAFWGVVIYVAYHFISKLW